MTGLSGAGKSTIAEALAAQLRAAGRNVSILDGDELRKHLSADLGFDRASRDRQVRRAAELAAADAVEGKVAIAALMAPFDAARRDARAVVEPVARFLLVHVVAPLEVAEARDPKGLYRRARAGEISDFIGLDVPFEAPLDADLVIDTTTVSVGEAVWRISAAIEEMPDRNTRERLGDWRAAERAEAETSEGSSDRRRAGATSRRARWAFEDAVRAAGQDHGAAPEALGDKMGRARTRQQEASSNAADAVGGQEPKGRPAPETDDQRDKRVADDLEISRELGE